jgi:6-phosphogluconolactonase
MKTRRRNLNIILALFTLLPLAVDGKPKDDTGKEKYLVYVGTDTKQPEGSGKGIYGYHYDSASGQLVATGLAAETADPSFLAIHPNRAFLYAVNEINNYKGQSSGVLSAFAIDRKTGKLTLLNQVPSRGSDPCYIIADKTGRFVLVANYTGGNVAVFPILENGGLGEASAFVQHSGHGRNPQRQEGPHPHYINLSADNRFAVAADLGLDEIFIYRFDSTKGTLTASDPKFVSVNAGAGPRHFEFSPNGKFAYVINEMQSTVTAFSYDADRGQLHSLQTISTLPKDFAGANDDAEIQVHPSGKFLYASNRGHDSIAVFAIDQSKGTLTALEYVSTQGKQPRSFEIDPTGSRLFAANQKSDSIVIFRIDPKTGRLAPTGDVLHVPSPVCVKFVAAE